MFQFPSPANDSLLAYCGAVAANLLAGGDTFTWLVASLSLLVLLIGCVVLWRLEHAGAGGAVAMAGGVPKRAWLPRRVEQALIAVLLVGFVVAGGATVWKVVSAVSAPGEAGVAGNGGPPGGDFSLIDHEGQPVTAAAFRGRLMLVAFGYTTCPDVCPTTLNTMTETLDFLGPQAEAVAPLFITVDPQRDTEEVLAGFVENFHAGITGLTGDAAQIRAAADAYRVYYGKSAGADADDEDYLIDHTTFVYLMGRDGRFLRRYTLSAGPEEIGAAIQAHLAAPTS